MRTLAGGLAALVFLAAGCGGGASEIPDQADKEAIVAAGLGIAEECIGAPDEIAIANHVDVLAQEADEAGNAEFALPGTASTTMREVIERRIAVLEDGGCSPQQAKRLRDALP